MQWACMQNVLIKPNQDSDEEAPVHIDFSILTMKEECVCSVQINGFFTLKLALMIYSFTCCTLVKAEIFQTLGVMCCILRIRFNFLE